MSITLEEAKQQDLLLIVLSLTHSEPLVLALDVSERGDNLMDIMDILTSQTATQHEYDMDENLLTVNFTQPRDAVKVITYIETNF